MNFLDKVGEKLAALGRQLGYLIHYKSNVDNLNTQVNELGKARDSVQRDVDSAVSNGMKIYDYVERRLTGSDDIIAVAGVVLEDDRPANITYCNGWCPNLMSRYQVSKRADKAASEAKNLKDEILKFNRVGYREPKRGYEEFESRRPILTDVLEALKNPNIPRIGLYGMGGIGKTMLVKEVLKQAEKEKLFDKYLFLVVSNDPDFKRIETEIAEQLDLILETESELARRDQLRERLKQENRVLIILDDIWKYLDLETLGIFFGDDQKGCKLLLTSRLQNTLRDMDTQLQFPVGVLSDNEAISLFEKIVGDLARTGEIKSIMPHIVKECAGLPIAITTVANSLKKTKNIYVWNDALDQLKMSRSIEIVGTDEKAVYKSIKLSYEFLPDEEKSLLLLCSLHGKDYDIEIEDLLKYAVGWDLLKDDHKIKHARSMVHKLVEGLKDSCLLMDGDDNGTVKMHGVIRDVVINIAAEEKHMFTIRTAIEFQNLSKREDAVAISLPYINDDLELPNQSECTKLELLLLFNQEIDFRIPDSFFEGLKDLKVLKLSRSWSGVLPSSLSSLENLQTLCLDGEVQNAIMIGELKNLQALKLSLSNTERLPKEIGQLTHLQLLDLRECSELKFIPPNVLSNLKMLEELYLPDNVEWEVEVQSIEKINAMVSELDHLSHLSKLHICIKNAKILPKAMVFERLESYRIAIGSAWLGYETSETSRILKLNISFQSDYVYKVLSRKCETLILDEMKGVKNILYELDSEGFQNLKHLTVQHNDEIQYIMKSMGVLDYVFPSLESITLLNVNNLEQICFMRPTTETFCNLRVVRVSSCCKLNFVFSSSMVGCFSHLQEMNIEDCKIMSAIVAIEREEEIEVNSDDIILFANLHSLKLRNLFKLKGFLSVVDSLVFFNGKVVFPNLKELEIKGMDSMKMIWSNQLISDCFGKIETMTVSGCINLTNIGPPNMLRMLWNLKELKIYDCDSLEEVLEIEGTNNVEESYDIVATKLISLTLRNLKKVKHVWSMDPQGIITFEKLNTIEIAGCFSLKSVFPTSVAKALMQLENLWIKDCATVEEIIAKEEGIETTTLFIFPQLTMLTLQNLPELKSFYPGKHISEWPLLNSLLIFKCDKLKIFGSNKSSVQETNGLTHHANLIQQPFFFNVEVVFPNLEELVIEGMDRMKMIWPNQLISDSFGKLRTVSIYGCSSLKSIFLTSVAKALMQLEKLEIMDCAMVEEIVAKEEGIEIATLFVFPQLTTLTLQNLPELKSFYPGKHISEWPLLNYLLIFKCDKLKIFGSNKSSVQETNGLTHHFFNEKVVFPNLEELVIKGMDRMKMIWHNQLISDSFGKLRTVSIYGCSSLKSIFLTSVAKALMQLEKLEITDCATVEEIVAKEEGIETTTLFVFPQLTTLTLQNLPELKSLYPGKHILEWPLLNCLLIFKCDKLKIFGSNKSSVQETNGLPHHAILVQQPVFFIEKVVFPNLEELVIKGMDRMKIIWPNQLISNSFGKLRTVSIYGCSSLKSIFLTSVAKALMQLEKLEIMDCATVEEIIAKEEGIETTTLFVFPQLTMLTLQNLPELKSFYPGKHISEWLLLNSLLIFKCDKLKIFGSNKSSVQETNGLAHHANLIQQPLFFIEKVVFPNLEELVIKGMDRMKMIWPNHLISDSFGKLRTVSIYGCSSLKSIFLTSVAKALMQLEKLEITDCATVEEIVAKEEGIETTTLLLFPQLTRLTLQNLPEFKSFYSGKYISEWPLLNYLLIFKCDKLKIFGSNKSSIQEINGPAHHANLIQQPLFFIEKEKFPNLEYLSLDDAMNETCGEPSAEFYCNLKELRLYGNSRQHKSTRVSDFRRLKNIMPFSSTSFHYLKELDVYDCDELISLLTPSTARTLVQLQFWTIKRCKRMIEIVANEGSEAEAGYEIAFNNLRHLEFHDLPSLTAFHLGNRTIKFPSLNNALVTNCPKFKIFCNGVLSAPKLSS